MSNFQISILGVFLFFIVLGVILFAGFGNNTSTTIGTVNIWGTVDKNIMENLLAELRREDDSFTGVKYKEVNSEIFDEELAEALASGKGPDVFMLSQYSILKHQDKIFPIPYESYLMRDFKDKFIEEGELYLKENGILSLPFIVDPLVMYWNRDIFSRKGISVPPTSWDEFFDLSQNITEKDDNLNILTSLVPFGEFRNINNAKEIISTLIMQAGSPITERSGDDINIALTRKKTQSSIMPAEEAINFFTQFSNPVNSVYTWNRSLVSSEKLFLTGDLAIYFGFASELEGLRAKNPNLNFDVAPIPQTNNDNNATFGRMWGLSIARNSKNIGGSFNAIKGLTGDVMLRKLSELNNLPPVSRNLLVKRPESPYLDVFYRSAIFSKAWLDPRPEETSLIFQDMIESIISGRERTVNAINRASSEMKVLVDDLEN
ncbi:extracellular solute-binding protein [Patescibacteria group bacterium]|nr:extracellular solute-binding protein [Patescibacteria group bacterium]